MFWFFCFLFENKNEWKEKNGMWKRSDYKHIGGLIHAQQN